MSRRILTAVGFVGATVCGGCTIRTIQNAHCEKTEASSTLSPSVQSAGPDTKNLKLKQVQIFFRHGARTPLHLIPKVEEVSVICVRI